MKNQPKRIRLSLPLRFDDRTIESSDHPIILNEEESEIIRNMMLDKMKQKRLEATVFHFNKLSAQEQKPLITEFENELFNDPQNKDNAIKDAYLTLGFQSSFIRNKFYLFLSNKRTFESVRQAVSALNKSDYYPMSNMDVSIEKNSLGDEEIRIKFKRD